MSVFGSGANENAFFFSLVARVVVRFFASAAFFVKGFFFLVCPRIGKFVRVRRRSAERVLPSLSVGDMTSRLYDAIGCGQFKTRRLRFT